MRGKQENHGNHGTNRARQGEGGPRLIVWLGDRRYSGRPHEIVGRWRAESLVTEAQSLEEYFAEVRDWTHRLTGRRVREVRTSRELIDELVRVGVARIERRIEPGESENHRRAR